MNIIKSVTFQIYRFPLILYLLLQKGNRFRSINLKKHKVFKGINILQFFKMYRGLPKNTYILFFVQLINRLGDFVIPFLSLYLTSKLGCSTEITGIIVSFAFLVQIPGSLVGGTIADFWSRKKTYLISQAAAALCILSCALISSKALIIALLILSAFFFGRRETINKHYGL